ncbi:family 18 glycoside hydrolase, partial [Aureobasidium melanogenum]
MRTLLTGLLLTLLPASVLCLNSVCQGGIELLATGASSDRAQGTGLTGLDVVTTTAFASSQALTTVSPRRVLRSYDLPKGFTQSSVKDSVGDNDGYRAAAYYVNWATYARNYQPYDLPVENLTHVFYAFANIGPEDGKVFLSETYADTDKIFPSETWSESSTNLRGCLEQLFLLKKKNRRLKTLLSIGGSTYSQNIGNAISTEQGRQNFAQTAVALLADLGFDGLDIDWEHVETDADAQSYVSLLSTVRAELDKYALSLPQHPRFLLTVASSCGPSSFDLLKLTEMDHYVDFWNLMAYDFAGSWSALTGHQANVYLSTNNTASTPFSTNAAVDRYIQSAGIISSKLVLGMPLYGRVFAETVGPGSSYVGSGNGGDWEPGIWDFKSLPRPGAVENCDQQMIACWSYDSLNKLMVTYDTPYSASAKADYIKQRNLGGAMWWESSGDRTDERSIINSVVDKFKVAGADQMDNTYNVLHYPSSKYDNVRNTFPNG